MVINRFLKVLSCHLLVLRSFFYFLDSHSLCHPQICVHMIISRRHLVLEDSKKRFENSLAVRYCNHLATLFEAPQNIKSKGSEKIRWKTVNPSVHGFKVQWLVQNAAGSKNLPSRAEKNMGSDRTKVSFNTKSTLRLYTLPCHYVCCIRCQLIDRELLTGSLTTLFLLWVSAAKPRFLCKSRQIYDSVT